ncbi:dTDP-4-dehydrorhamnose reductase [Candidatus Omnitrophota bacterium]
MKVLVTGSEGMLGQALMKVLPEAGFEVEGTDIRSDKNRADITSDSQIISLINQQKPDIVIHAAAFTDVDASEQDPAKASYVNGIGTKNVAVGCKESDAFCVYISTDFIFDGNRTIPYTEKDLTGPLNAYGRSKLEGENFISEILTRSLIIRSSWLFGEGGKNFVDTIINKAIEEKYLRVVDDQRGSPTYTMDLAHAIVRVLPQDRESITKTLHISNSGFCTWFEFAREILDVKALKDGVLEAAASSEIGSLAIRPKMSILDNSKLKSLYGDIMPSWQDALRRYITREER